MLCKTYIKQFICIKVANDVYQTLQMVNEYCVVYFKPLWLVDTWFKSDFIVC